MSKRDHEPSASIYLRLVAAAIRSGNRALDTNDASQIEHAADMIHEASQSFDLRWAATMRGAERWRKANPGNDLVLPDHADLVVWLLDQFDRAAAIERKACIEVCEQQKRDFLSEQYATPQPVGSIMERFAIDECIKAIRQRELPDMELSLRQAAAIAKDPTP